MKIAAKINYKVDHGHITSLNLIKLECINTYAVSSYSIEQTKNIYFYSRIKMSDKGVYTVIAENSFGKREEHGTLKVEGLYLSMNCLYLLQKQKSI
jgi:hypothetical protein